MRALGQVSTEAKGKPSTLVEAMTQNSRGLGDISEDFVQIAPKYTIKTMYETKPLATTGRLVVPMLSTRMFGHNQDEMPIEADHLSMCQFTDRDDPDFLLVSSFIREATEGEVTRVRHPIAATTLYMKPEKGVTGQQQNQANQTSKTQIGHILGQPLYIDAPPLRHRPSRPFAGTRNDKNVLPSIISSHEQPALPAPASGNIDIEDQAVTVPVALPYPTPQLRSKEMQIPRVVPVERESENVAKQPRWFSRVMVGIRHKGAPWR